MYYLLPDCDGRVPASTFRQNGKPSARGLSDLPLETRFERAAYIRVDPSCMRSLFTSDQWVGHCPAIVQN